MGEIAEGMLDGEFDYVTGEYIGQGVGFPRTLQDDKYVRRKKNKNPVSNYTHDNRVVWEYMVQVNDSLKNGFEAAKSRLSAYTKEYGQYKNFESVKTSDICKMIRETNKSWKEFKNWFKEKIK